MRTNIEIDDALIAEAQSLSHLKTKKKIVEEAVKSYIALLKRQNMVDLFGKVEWVGDLNEMRTLPE
jgi:Arc/MetJ family transcription regulator